MSQAPASDPQRSQPDQRSASAGGSSSSVNTLALIVAALIAAMLQFAAFAKLISANPHIPVPGTKWLAENTPLLSKSIVEGHFIGVMEMVIVMLILIFYRWRHTWTLLTIFFIGMAGFATYAFVNGRDCGCFGDVVKLPRGFTIWMDLGIAALAMLIMWLKGVRAKGIVVTLVVSAGAFGGGWFYGTKSVPPPASTFKSGLEIRETPRRSTQPVPVDESIDESVVQSDPEFYFELDPMNIEVRIETVTNAARELVASNILHDERGDEMGTAFYIFIHDPACSVCEQLKPMVLDAQDRFEEEGNPLIRVREFSVPFLFENLDIKYFAWESTPTVIVLKDGAIIHESYGQTVPMPEEIEEQLMSGELE